jgi:hypothetical protein
MKKLILGLAAAVVVIVILPTILPIFILPALNKFTINTAGTRILLINDFPQPVTVRILRDDGDNALNKTWSERITLQPNTSQEYAKIGQVYCLLFVKQGQVGTRFALPIEKINDASKEQGRASGTRTPQGIHLSALEKPCLFSATDPPRNE